MNRLLLPFLLLLAFAVYGDDLVPAAKVSKWEKDIAAFESADKARDLQPGGIVFTGSSSIRLWKTLAADFPGHRVINRGFGGSEISDSIQFFERVVLPHKPRLIVLYAGGNDLNNGKSPEQVIADFKTYAEKVHTALPSTELAYISIAGNPARWAQVEKVRQINTTIAAWIAERPWAKFINVFPAMMGEDGLPKPDIFVADKLHMNEKGYAIWREVVRPFLGPGEESK